MGKKLIKINTLKKKVVEACHKYVRLRDTNGGVDSVPCISCGKHLRYGDRDINAGHFYPSTYSFLKFNLDNIHAQCVGCNKWKGGNGAPYRIFLEHKIGKERVQYLDDNYLNPVKWDREALMSLLEDFKYKISQYGY